MASWFVEQAKEELEILEAQHPNRFGCLKQELKNLISEPQNFPGSFPSPFCSGNSFHLQEDSVSSSASTQVSTNRKRKGCGIRRTGTSFRKSKQKKYDHGSSCLRDRVEIVMEKAEACLRKIREVKESFING